jgi:dTDP-4-amino-4,6-dideoxygalactose transaminase
MFRLVPPAGIPVSISDIIKIIRARLVSARGESDFAAIIRDISGAKHCWFINSGRAANYIILKTIRELSDNSRNEIVIPAYTCYSVPASIARAGLKIRLVDIDPDAMDYDYEQLGRTDLSKALAILPANLFGIVSDWSRLKGVVGDKGIYLIDDSAQTLGLSYNGDKCGSLGDIGFYSFGRGKNLTTYSGGAIVTNNDQIGKHVDNLIMALPSPGVFAEMTLFAEFLFYAIMMRPWLYWIPDRLPFLELGKTAYDENFSVKSLSKLQLAAGPIIYSKFSQITKTRYENANALAHKIVALGSFSVPGWREGLNIPFIRLPILAMNSHTRDKAIARLRRKGIAASGMYPSAIDKIPLIGKHLVNPDDKFPGAGQVAERLFTLPTHSYLNSKDISTIISCLVDV